MTTRDESSRFDRRDAEEPLPSGPPLESEPLPFGYPPGPATMRDTPASRSRWGCGCAGCLTGCLAVLVVTVVASALAVRTVVQRAPDIARSTIDQVVQESDLPDQDKQAVMQQVDRLVAAYKQKKIDTQQLGDFGRRLLRSPLMDLMIAHAAKVQYIDPSGLTPEEKADAEQILKRLARGVMDEKISQSDLDAALDEISTKMPNGGRQFKDHVSDEELRAFLVECQRVVEEADIPMEGLEVDIAEELKKLVDETLGESAPAETVTETAPAETVGEAASGETVGETAPADAPESTSKE